MLSWQLDECKPLVSGGDLAPMVANTSRLTGGVNDSSTVAAEAGAYSRPLLSSI
jgi:hypothetical protein